MFPDIGGAFKLLLITSAIGLVCAAVLLGEGVWWLVAHLHVGFR